MWDDFCVRVESGLWRWRPGASFTSRATLRVNECDTSDGLIDGWNPVVIPAVEFPTLARVLHVALAFDAPTGSRVTFRLYNAPTDGDDGARWWDGEEWAAPEEEDQWNTAVEVQAHVAAWPHRSLGVAASLRSDDGVANPSFYGMDAHLELELSRDSGDVRLPSNVIDAAIVRGMVAALRSGVEVWDVDEFLAPAVPPAEEGEDPAPSVIDYSRGKGATTRQVLDVGAVYDATADAERTTPLTGTWDAVAKTWTADENFVEGHRISVRLRVDPLVAFVGDSDRATEHLPVISIEGLREDRRTTTVSRSVLVDEAAQVVHVLDGSDAVDLLYDVVCIGEDVAEACDVSDAVQEWLGSGRRLHVPALAERFDLTVAGPGTTGPRGELAESVVTMRLARVKRYSARERTVAYAREFQVDSRGIVNRV